MYVLVRMFLTDCIVPAGTKIPLRRQQTRREVGTDICCYKLNSIRKFLLCHIRLTNMLPK